MLDHKQNVSYADYELRKAREKEEEFTIKKIIGNKSENGKILYKIWWKGYPKAEATWEERKQLKKDVPKMLKDYESKQSF
jgi:hypothetical protein